MIAFSVYNLMYMQVKVYCSSMEVFVAYRLDDFSIELSVIVPDCYPLLAPSIKEGKRARVDTNLWRKWLLQLNAFVANQVSGSTCMSCMYCISMEPARLLWTILSINTMFSKLKVVLILYIVLN